MKKISILTLLAISLGFSAVWSNQCFNDNIINTKDSIKFYYIRARDYSAPSFRTRTQAGKELIKMINSANYSIDFAFYGFSYQDDILNALLAAKARGVIIRGIVDENVFGKNDYTGTHKVIKKLGQDIVKSDYIADVNKKKNIDSGLQKYKYDFFYGHIMHNKFCIVDNSKVWVGTVNVSTTGTGGYNENVAVIIQSSNIASYYKKEFEQMYLEQKFHENKTEIFSQEGINVGDTSVRVYFSPSKRIINDGILQEIKKANNYIYVSMFLITNEKIVKELINAHQRGVDVKLITEANHAMQKYSLHENLRKAGIPVKVENWAGKMHSKTAVIDDNTIISGSANWTNSAFYHNDENLSVYSNIPKQAKYLKKEFLLSWKSIPDKWLHANPKPEGEDSPMSCFDGMDNDYNGLIDADDPACKNVKNAPKPTKYNYELTQPHER